MTRAPALTVTKAEPNIGARIEGVDLRADGDESLIARLQLPATGGDTAFANQHLAYETLPDRLREVLDGADAFHSGKVFGPDTPDSVHPAIRTHDESGRKALYVNAAFTRSLVDVDPDLAELVMAETLLHATRVEFTCRHGWDLHDLVIWDNRSVTHCPSFDYDGDRFMDRAVVAGGVPV